MDINIRRLEGYSVAIPPSGAMALAVARHIAEPESEFDATELHEHRAKLIHNLVNELSLDVKKWGGTDESQPSEIVELIIALGPPAIAAAATIIAAMIMRPAKVSSGSEGVLGIKLRRADGQELTVTYLNKPQGEAASVIEAFMRGDRK